MRSAEEKTVYSYFHVKTRFQLRFSILLISFVCQYPLLPVSVSYSPIPGCYMTSKAGGSEKNNRKREKIHVVIKNKQSETEGRPVVSSLFPLTHSPKPSPIVITGIYLRQPLHLLSYLPPPLRPVYRLLRRFTIGRRAQRCRFRPGPAVRCWALGHGRLDFHHSWLGVIERYDCAVVEFRGGLPEAVRQEDLRFRRVGVVLDRLSDLSESPLLDDAATDE